MFLATLLLAAAPALGKTVGNQQRVGVLMYKYLNHHLRQFGSRAGHSRGKSEFGWTDVPLHS
jgi:hypothetical protein